VNNLYETEDCYGDADPEKKLIRLQNSGSVKRVTENKKKQTKVEETVNITEEDLLETYFHEVVHIVLDAMGENKLYSNEKFVSLMGKCLMEIEKTKNDQNK
jgi:hypothetical protein